MTNKEKREFIKAAITKEAKAGRATQSAIILNTSQKIIADEHNQMIQTMTKALEDMLAGFLTAEGRQITNTERQTIDGIIQTFTDTSKELSASYIEEITKLNTKLLDDIMDKYTTAAQKICDNVYED